MTPNPTQPANAPDGRPPSAMPVVALVFSIVGICLPPLLLVGLILAIVSLVQKKGNQTLSIISLVVPLGAVPIIGILAAIAIPNFIRFQARSKQTECKIGLKAAYAAQRGYFAEKNAYSAAPKDIELVIDPGNRYLYRLSNTGPLTKSGAEPGDGEVGFEADRLKANATTEALDRAFPAELRQELGLSGQCPDCSVTMACAGNIDNDAAIDVWSISTAERTSPTGEKILPGELFQHVDDLKD